MQRKVIVNADDFGRDESTNAAILDCNQNGMVNSVSVFATSPIWHKTIQSLKTLRNADFGVHLDLTFGAAVSDFGKFPPKCELVAALKQLPAEKIISEFRAQIRRALEAGLALTHIDTHRPEIYLFPNIFERVIDLSEEFGLILRMPSDEMAKDDQQKSLIKKYRNSYKNKTLGLVLFSETKFDREGLVSTLLEHPANVIEICTHPGTAHPQNKEEALFWKSDDLRALLENKNIEIVSRKSL